MSIAKQYQDKIDYLRYIDGWLSDYPNLEEMYEVVLLENR